MRQPIPCCIEAPDAFVPKARYALETLLTPLGLAPVWADRTLCANGGVYYGPRSEMLPEPVVSIPLDPDTADFFASGEVYRPDDARLLDWGGDHWPVLFPRTPTGGLPDLIASAFFWLAGWQEVTTRVRDEHGRFPFRASLQAALGCARAPLVDVYREVLAEALAAQGILIRRQHWQGKPWAVAMTHDVDLLRKRRLGTIARAVLRGDGRRAAALRQAAFAADPRRVSLGRMVAAERSRRVSATYFFKTAARGPWDVPYAAQSPYLRHLLRDLESGGFEVGLHPSYFGHDHLGHLVEERDRLTSLLREPPLTVRQHFLRFDPVATPRLQQAAGFRLDSTLGFARQEGFRRGTCFPFRLFDVPTNAPLGLWELPLAVMDTTLFTHRGLDGDAAERAIGEVLDVCSRVGGCCVVLWHNTIYDEVDYPGQAAVFERTLDRALEQRAAVLSLRGALDALDPPAGL